MCDDLLHCGGLLHHGGRAPHSRSVCVCRPRRDDLRFLLHLVQCAPRCDGSTIDDAKLPTPAPSPPRPSSPSPTTSLPAPTPLSLAHRRRLIRLANFKNRAKLHRAHVKVVGRMQSYTSCPSPPTPSPVTTALALTLTLVAYDPTSTLATHQGIGRQPGAGATDYRTVTLRHAFTAHPNAHGLTPDFNTVWLMPPQVPWQPTKGLDGNQVLAPQTERL